MSHYDYVCAGGGAAGLSLAYHMVRGGLNDKSILIVDLDAKRANDRTWCFWEKEPMLVDEIVSHRWNHLWFHGPERSHRIPLGEYDYRMVRGIDFYEHTRRVLGEAPNVTFLQDRVEEIIDGDEDAAATIRTEHNGEVTADWVFDSLFFARDFRVDTSRYHFFKQHFIGWVVRAPEPVFDPDAATFFDFRVEQRGAFRFMYLLPTSPTESLVEYTLFSPDLLPKEEYEHEIETYLRGTLKLDSYEILEREDGIIPMTEQPFPRRGGKRIMYTGTKGGRVKASTGFAFHRTQRDSERIVESLKQNGHPFHGIEPPRRYRTFDAMLLSVLKSLGGDGHRIFVELFENNPVERIFGFLNEEAGLIENIKYMSSVPAWPFIKAWFRLRLNGIKNRTL